MRLKSIPVCVVSASTLLLGHAAWAAGSYSLPVNFAAGSLSSSGYVSGFAPPDTNGAVGTANIAELINGQYLVYNKTLSGAANTPVFSENLKSFWKSALSSGDYSAAFTPSGSATSVGISDPRIVYDPASGDWFASSITVPENSSGVSGSNDFLLAETADPLTGWHGITYAAQPSSTSTPEFADFPTLGVTANYVTLAGNMYTVPSTLNNFTSSAANADVLVLPKSSVVAGAVTGGQLFNYPFSNLGFTNQPVNDYSGNTGHTTYLFSNYQQSAFNAVGYTENLNQTNVVPGNPVSLDINFNLATFNTQTGGPTAGAAQPGSANAIDSGDDRLSSSLVFANGQVWGAQTIANPANSSISSLRIFGVTPATADNTSPVLTNEIVLSDPNHPDSSLYYGSIAVSTDSTVVIAFNESSGTQYVGAYAAVGHINGSGMLSLGTPFLLKAGTATYTLNTGTYRWGDYSTTVVDPTNPNAFWTFQELPAADGTWSTQVTEILTPEPAGLMLLCIGAVCLLGRRRNRIIPGQRPQA